MSTKLKISMAALAAFCVAAPLQAQWAPMSFSIGGGFTTPMRHANGPLQSGYNVTASIGVRPASTFSLNGEFGFNKMGLSPTALNQLVVPAGGTRIYSVTLQPTWYANPNGWVNVYFTVGGGYYRRTVEFTQATTSLITGFDPFYGFFPAEVPSETVLGSFVQNKGGVNGGVGLAFKVNDDSAMRLFAEARYHHVFTSGRDTNYLPVTFGFRW